MKDFRSLPRTFCNRAKIIEVGSLACDLPLASIMPLLQIFYLSNGRAIIVLNFLHCHQFGVLIASALAQHLISPQLANARLRTLELFKQLEKFLPAPLKVLALRFDRSPFHTVADLQEFTQTRASYVAQTSLYGYLKTRMGTRYRSLFEDDAFSHSARTSAAKIFGTCLSDLSIHSAALCRNDGGLNEVESSSLASLLVSSGLEKGLVDFPDSKIKAEALGRLNQRLAVLSWDKAGDNAITFASSESDLVKFAPVVDEFKELDREIVMNSIRFRWRDVREQLRKRLSPQSVAQDFRRDRAIKEMRSQNRTSFN